MLLDSRRLKVRMGDRVVYCAPGDSPVPAVVRFLGAVPELRSRGYLLGLEVTLEDWGLGETDGSVEGRRYFNTDPIRGVFCDVGKVRIEEIHSKEKLESLNRGTVGRITAMIDNNNMVKNGNMMRDKRDGESRSRDGVLVERVKLANVQRIGDGHYQVRETRPSVRICMAHFLSQSGVSFLLVKKRLCGEQFFWIPMLNILPHCLYIPSVMPTAKPYDWFPMESH